VDVIGHQAKTIDGHAELCCLFFEETEKCSFIILHKKYVLLIIAPLRDMMRHIRYYNSRFSWHNRKYKLLGLPVNHKLVNVPNFPYFLFP